MTHFEYITVVISMILAIAVAELFKALIPAATSPARYWPHLVWLVTMALVIAYTWWAYWNVRAASWTGPLLAYSLINPALLTVQAELLTSKDPYSVPSFRNHFHAIRRPFFALLLITSLNGFFTAWIFGSVPVGTIAPIQISTSPFVLLAFAGFFLRTDTACGLLAILALVLVLAALSLHPILPAH